MDMHAWRWGGGRGYRQRGGVINMVDAVNVGVRWGGWRLVVAATHIDITMHTKTKVEPQRLNKRTYQNSSPRWWQWGRGGEWMCGDEHIVHKILRMWHASEKQTVRCPDFWKRKKLTGELGDKIGFDTINCIKTKFSLSNKPIGASPRRYYEDGISTNGII